MKKYIKEIRWIIVLSMFLFGVETVLISIMLLFPGYLIDTYTKGVLHIVQLIVIYGIVFVIYLISAYISNRCGDIRRIRFERSIKRDFFTSIMNQNKASFIKHDIGEYISMQANDITELCQNYLGPLISIFRSVIMIIIFGFALFLYTSGTITAVIIGTSLAAIFIPRLTSRKLAQKNYAYFKLIGKYTEKMRTFFQAHPIQDQYVKKSLRSVHEMELEGVLNKQMAFRKLNSLALVLNGGAVEGISVIAFCIVAILLVKQEITVGMAIVAFTYSTKFIDPIHEFNLNVSRIKSVDKIKERVLLFTQTKSQPALPEVAFETASFQDVQKSFQNHTVTLPNLKFYRGATHLIVGDNGTGKSLLLKMLVREQIPNKGEIRINDKYLIQDVSLDEQIAYIPQQNIILEAGYIENVTVYDAYSSKNLERYESYFPSHLIQKIKQRDDFQKLSGGEKQIIALLRALCSEKPILILDEPFSAMNSQTIEHFLTNLSDLDRTVIMVAHQLENYEHIFTHVYESI